MTPDTVDRQFQELGYAPDYPPDVIRGVRLNDAQYDDYVRLSGRLAKMQLEQLVSHPNWNAVPDDSKLSLMKATINKARNLAQTAVMIKSQGGDNDIMKQATDAKLAMARAVPAEQPEQPEQEAAVAE